MTILEVKELVSKEEAPEASIKIDAENDIAGFCRNERVVFRI